MQPHLPLISLSAAADSSWRLNGAKTKQKVEDKRSHIMHSKLTLQLRLLLQLCPLQFGVFVVAQQHMYIGISPGRLHNLSLTAIVLQQCSSKSTDFWLRPAGFAAQAPTCPMEQLFFSVVPRPLRRQARNLAEVTLTICGFSRPCEWKGGLGGGGGRGCTVFVVIWRIQDAAAEYK